MLKSVALASYTTFKIGGPAAFFTVVRSRAELLDAIRFSRAEGVPWMVLGRGSNVVFSDNGYPGVVIKMEMTGLEVEEQDGVVELAAGAGEDWDALVSRSVREGWYGLENLTAIPGTVGAAPIQNIGAYGVEVSAVISWVEVWDVGAGCLRTLCARECGFGYRTSIFKLSEGRELIVLRVGFSLSRHGVPNVTYGDVAVYVRGTPHPSLQDVRDAIVAIRAQKFPDLSTFGTAGSYFENPVVPRAQGVELKRKYPTLPVYEVDKERVKVSLAWLLDHALHLRGTRRGNVGTWKRQPLVLVNYGGASSAELDTFAAFISERVRNELGIHLVREVMRV